MSKMKEFVKKGQIPTFDCDEAHWTKWNVVETFEDLELEENSEEEIDVYSSAFHSRQHAWTMSSPSSSSTPGPSGSRESAASSPLDYTPLPNLDDTLYTPSPSP
ncbi:hypothetical protein PM082_022880 [Marasmius tenuissimus]|nr:hypothetical protein PM082_022880 [Marasmius tenuissimus]